jgi:hypothetical protein
LGRDFVIDDAFANISVRGFAKNSSIIDNTFANVLVRGFDFYFNVIAMPSPTFCQRGSNTDFDVIEDAFCQHFGKGLHRSRCQWGIPRWGVAAHPCP